MLVDQAIGQLAGCGEEADILRAVARYVLERDH
jgi:farnesyl diphosphate synthase